MSYSIIRVQKMNGQAIKGIQIHNQREKESETNPDIRKEDMHHQKVEILRDKTFKSGEGNCEN